jgi:hypothetical protein
LNYPSGKKSQIEETKHTPNMYTKQ